jgi:hypothetical protein
MTCIQGKSRDDGVSPVVGVMLMLVVTIIIAAVVSAFAGGVGSTQSKTPQASIAIKTGYVSDGNFDISFEHLGGDPILTKDCKFITYLVWPNGTTVRHEQSPSSSLARSETAVLAGSYTYSRGPHLTDPQKYAYPCNPASDVTLPTGWTVQGYTSLEDQTNPAWFGKAVWLPGDIARTYNNGYTANFVGLVANPMSPTSGEIATLKDCVAKNCRLDIKLLHVPSGKYIIDQSVTLQG